MHLRFEAALAVVFTPPSPHGAAQASLRLDRFVSGSGSSARRLPRFGVLARRDLRMGVSGGNRLVAFARVVSVVCRDGPQPLFGWDLVEQLGQHGSITYIACRDLHSLNVKCFLVDSDGYLALYPAFRAAVLAGVPCAFTLGFDAGTIDQKVQRAVAALIWQAHVQCLLAATQGAEIWHCPVQPDRSPQTFRELGRLPKWHTKWDLQRQASLNGGVTALLLPTALAARRRRPNHLGIKPDRPRSALLQVITVKRSIHGLVLRRGPTAHALQLSCWIYTVTLSNRSA
jgi:hypothetical protein